MIASILRRLTLLSKGAGYFSFALGLVVLAGWSFDISWAKSIHPAWIAMRANTALCFVFSGIALFLLHRPNSTNAIRALGSLIGILGALNLLQYLFKIDFGIDQLFFTQGTEGIGALPPGRMAANTAVNFIFVGLALLFPETEIRNRVRVAEIFGLLVGLLALPTLIAYLYGANFHAALTIYVQMAIHTSIGFVALSLGLMTLRPERGLARLVSSRYAGGAQVRSLLPPIVVFPLAIGGLSLIGNSLGLYDIRFAMTLTIMITIAALLHRVYHHGFQMDALDRQREEAATQLLIANRDLEGQVQRRTSELLLAKKMSAIGEMAGGIAHELNTPLGTLYLSTETLRMELNQFSDKLAPACEIIDEMETTMKRMAQIVRGLLVFAQEGSVGKKTAQDLRKIVDDTLALCSPKFEAHNIKVVLDGPQGPVTVECRSGELSHALLNLLTNAVDACSEIAAPEVRVQIETQSPQVVISITDNGPRISDEVAEKIMQPFFTTKGIGKGTGLGLSIAKGLIESHQGTLFLDRTSDKTKFVINLPMSSPPT